MKYLEKEIKILDIDVQDLIIKLKELGAEEVFNDKRIITHFDYQDGKLQKEKKIVKLTEEGSLKLTYSEEKESIKLRTSRKQETVDFLNRLGLLPISESLSHRISFEWEGVDFDIDEFPQVPPFLEIDLGETNHKIEEILTRLSLEKNEKREMGTPDVYEKYELDYFTLFKI